MKVRVLVGLALSALCAGTVRATDPQVDPGAATWVIASDVPPFALGRGAHLAPGQGLATRFLGDHPDDLRASADYEDTTRGVYVTVQVVRNGRTDFLDHLIEDAYRDDRSGRLDGPESTVTTVLGQAVYFFCDHPPDCTQRTYAWRSGAQIFVQVEASAFVDTGPPGPPVDLERTSCPVPIEMLQVYLDRYPSALTAYSDTDERAKQWLRDEAALRLSAADYQLDRAASLPEAEQRLAVDAARDQLEKFVQLRAVVFRGPPAEREYGRIRDARELGPPASIAEMRKLRDEYRQWWAAHHNDPITLP